MQKYLKYFLFTTVSLSVLTLDQVTKLIIHTQFLLGESKEVIPGFFDLTYIRNKGGVFGLFADGNEVIRKVLFLILPVFAFILILSIIRTLETKQKYQVMAFSFIFGGAMGNYIDRIRFGYVVDFFDFYIKKWKWPAFNIGDSFIVIGVFLAIVTIYFTNRKQSPASSSD